VPVKDLSWVWWISEGFIRLVEGNVTSSGSLAGRYPRILIFEGLLIIRPSKQAERLTGDPGSRGR
jgi:hypothetical protein